MPSYNGKELKKVGDVTAGKNKNKGFYNTLDDKEQFFIKQPEDKKELFTELFAGLLLNEFKEHLVKALIKEGKLPEGSDKSLIFADWIRFDDGSYGLIQPKVAFIELFRLIGTGYKDDSDRDPFWEMINGPNAYPALTENGRYFGLSLSFMFSLLLGAYSVHSGNIVRLAASHPLEQIVNQFARVDWGDAFRRFASAANNKDILFPAEYEGLLNFKKYTKGYVQNYRNIVGFFTAVAKKGIDLTEKMIEVAQKDKSELAPETSAESGVETLFLTMVNRALSKIPADLLDSDTKKELADYLAIPAFANVSFGKEGKFDEVARTFATVLTQRLGKINALKEDLAPKHNEQDLYQSTLFTSPVEITTSKAPNEEEPFANTVFPDFVKMLGDKLHHADELNPEKAVLIDFSKIQLDEIIGQYNHYLDSVARQAEVYNLWQYQSPQNTNMLVAYNKSGTELNQGHAFVPYYRESTMLRRLSTVNPKTIALDRFRPYETPAQEYRAKHPDAPWTVTDSLFSTGAYLLAVLNKVKIAQEDVTRKIQKLDKTLKPKEIEAKYIEALEPLLPALSDAIKRFNYFQTQLEPLFNDLNPQIPPAFESNFFYPMNDNELKAMNGVQLATICLEELNDVDESPLLLRILKNDMLWQRVNEAFLKEAEDFNRRGDTPRAKISRLGELHEQVSTFFAYEKQFQTTSSFEEKEVALNALEEAMRALPPSFQQMLTVNVETAQKEFSQIKLLNNAYITKHDEFLQADNKIAALGPLKAAYEALPAYLQASYQNQITEAARLVWQARIASFDMQAVTEANEKMQQFTALQDFFGKLPETLAQEFKNELEQRRQENNFSQALKTYNSLPSLSERIDGFVNLDAAFKEVSASAAIQSLFNRLKSTKEILQTLLTKETFPAKEPLANIEKTLTKLQTSAQTISEPMRTAFIQQVLQDKILWNAIATTEREKLSDKLAADIIELKKFHDSKLALNMDNQFGAAYSTSVNNFYKQAVETRLSNAPLKTQVNDIVEAAHREFSHRHSTRRLIADVIMLVGVLFAGLGLVVGLGRVAAGNPFFFSSTPTEREAEIATWLQKPKEDNDDERIIVAPVA